MRSRWKLHQRLWIFIIMFLLLSKPALSSTGQTSAPSSPSTTEKRQALENEKLRQETIRIQFENQKSNSMWGRLLDYGSFITSLVAVGGLLLTISKQLSENRRQREQDASQQDKDRQQKDAEMLNRLEQQFSIIVANLGSKNPSLQASGAVQVMRFLRPEHQHFHYQAFLILYAQLKVQYNLNLVHSRTLGNLLVSAFDQAIRTQISDQAPHNSLSRIDLSRAYLYRAQLQNLDLSEADFAFSDLRSADLTATNLFRVRGYQVNLAKARLSRANLGEARLRKASLSEVQFHGATLIAADLRETDLSKAQFQQARLQSTHLDRADLTGARFEHANLNDTYFLGATIPIATLKSIMKANHWDKAHFDDDVEDKLLELSQVS
jgi:uncharacterized protein YjbI with pentapeptide repeats